MSDDTDTTGDSNADDTKHEAARRMAEAAMRAEQAGDTDRANTLIDQAEKTDPDAVVDVVEEMGGGTVPEGEVGDDLGSETVVPGSDAPSRAGISGSGSGADNQGL